MKRFLLVLITLAGPCLASADEIDSWVASSVVRKVVGSRQVCNGSYCTIQPVYGYVGIRQIAAAPAMTDSLPIRFASYSTPAAASFSSPPILPDVTGDFAVASRIVSVGQPVVTSSTCNCAVTGICTCDPATCACAACANGQVRMGLVGATQYATGNSYYSVANPTAIETNLIQTPTGHVHVYADGSTSHSGGHIQKKVAHQERWRARKGVK